MIDLKPIDVHCPVCKAQPGEKCRYVATKLYRGEIIRYGVHNRRKWDAASATDMANALTQ